MEEAPAPASPVLSGPPALLYVSRLPSDLGPSDRLAAVLGRPSGLEGFFNVAGTI